jgi:hypothetical protein
LKGRQQLWHKFYLDDKKEKNKTRTKKKQPKSFTGRKNLPLSQNNSLINKEKTVVQLTAERKT